MQANLTMMREELHMNKVAMFSDVWIIVQVNKRFTPSYILFEVSQQSVVNS